MASQRVPRVVRSLTLRWRVGPVSTLDLSPEAQKPARQPTVDGQGSRAGTGYALGDAVLREKLAAYLSLSTIRTGGQPPLHKRVMPDSPEGLRLSQAVLESAQAVVRAFEKKPVPGSPEFHELQRLLQEDIAVNQAYLDHLKKGMDTQKQ
jgi:hypothetical protein